MSDLWTAARSISALEVAERYAGVHPKRRGSKAECLCPFHNEKTPSCTFFPDGHFHCFGCHAGGSSIDFVMKLTGLSNVDAAKRICADYGIEYEDENKTPVTSKPEQQPPRRADVKEAVSTGYRIVCDRIRNLEHLRDQTQPKNRDDDPPDVFWKAIRGMEALSDLQKQLFDLMGRDEWSAAMELLFPYKNDLPVWDKANREVTKLIEHEKLKGGIAS